MRFPLLAGTKASHISFGAEPQFRRTSQDIPVIIRNMFSFDFVEDLWHKMSHLLPESQPQSQPQSQNQSQTAARTPEHC